MSEYFIHLMILIAIYSILSQSLNINFGLGGMFNLAHISCYAIGAYTTAILSVDHGFSFIPCIILSAIFAGILSLFLGIISLRLAMDYFAIATIAFSFIVTSLLINWKSLTKGVLGIPGIPRPELFNINFDQNLNFLILVTVFAVLSNVFLYILFRAPYSRTLQAQAEAETVALALGKKTLRARSMAFIISSGLAGIAGAFYAYYINYIDPSSFSLQEMIFVLSIVIVGRPKSFWGNIIACIFLVLLPEPLRFIEIDASILGPMRQLLYALILFITIYINRGKLFPIQRKV